MSDSTPRTLSRRRVIPGIVGLSVGLSRVDLSAQSASPDASPASSPVAVAQLQIVREQRPVWLDSPQTGGEIRLFTLRNGLDDFSPTAFRQDFQVTVSYLDPLIWLDEVDLTPRPWLADSWQWGSDGLELLISLRPDVVWHDGTPLTANDVQFSLQCYRDDYDSAVSWMFAVVEDIRALDATRIRIRFNEPDGAFLYNAGNLPVFNQTQYQGYWNSRPVGERTLSEFDWKASPPLGTGPWIVEVGSGEAMTFRRNAAHFAASPYAERLQLNWEPDLNRQIDAWIADDVDLAWPVPGPRVETLNSENGFVFVADAMVSLFAAYNFGNPNRADPGWMASPGLREALSLSIDRQRYADEVFGGFIDIERAGFMTQPWAIDPTVRNPGRDVGAANRLLDDAEWVDRDGDGVRESPAGDRGEFVCIVRDDADPSLLATLDSLKDDLGEVGLSIDVQRLDPDAFTRRWTEGFDYDLIAWSLTQYGAFAEFDLVGSEWSIRRNTMGWNPGGYWNPEVDDAISTWFKAWKQDDMVTALHTIQRATNDDPFALWLGFPQQPVLVRPTVAGYQPNKMWQSWNTWALWRQSRVAVVATPMPTPIPTPTPEPTPMPTVESVVLP